MVELYIATSDSWGKGLLNYLFRCTILLRLHIKVRSMSLEAIREIGASDRLFTYDPTTNEWTQGKPMPTPRGYPTANFVNGTLCRRRRWRSY